MLNGFSYNEKKFRADELDVVLIINILDETTINSIFSVLYEFEKTGE